MRSSESTKFVRLAPGVGERVLREGLCEAPFGSAPAALSGGLWAAAALAAAFFAARSLFVNLEALARGDCLLLDADRPLCPLWRDADLLGMLGSRGGGVTGLAPGQVLTPSP